jgi:hypothetical protein
VLIPSGDRSVERASTRLLAELGFLADDDEASPELDFRDTDDLQGAWERDRTEELRESLDELGVVL